MKNWERRITTIVALACLLGIAVLLTGPGLAASSDPEANSQIAELYQLQAAYHAAASGAGVSAEEKAEHLSEILALWTEDAVLVVGSTTYSERGVPGTPSCAPGSLTLCDFYTNHAGSFVLGRNWVSLAPSFKTTINVHGDTADFYFECHYFDVLTGAKMSDAGYGERGNPGSGQARKVDGVWLLSYAVATAPALSSY